MKTILWDLQVLMNTHKPVQRGQRQSSDVGFMRITYEKKYIAVFVQKWDMMK